MREDPRASFAALGRCFLENRKERIMSDQDKRREQAEALARENKPGQPPKSPERKEEERKVDEAIEESFPASDPPAFNKTTSGSGA
jgi:hypothetical protein